MSIFDAYRKLQSFNKKKFFPDNPTTDDLKGVVSQALTNLLQLLALNKPTSPENSTDKKLSNKELFSEAFKALTYEEVLNEALKTQKAAKIYQYLEAIKGNNTPNLETLNEKLKDSIGELTSLSPINIRDKTASFFVGSIIMAAVMGVLLYLFVGATIWPLTIFSIGAIVLSLQYTRMEYSLEYNRQNDTKFKLIENMVEMALTFPEKEKTPQKIDSVSDVKINELEEIFDSLNTLKTHIDSLKENSQPAAELFDVGDYCLPPNHNHNATTKAFDQSLIEFDVEDGHFFDEFNPRQQH